MVPQIDLEGTLLWATNVLLWFLFILHDLLTWSFITLWQYNILIGWTIYMIWKYHLLTGLMIQHTWATPWLWLVQWFVTWLHYLVGWFLTCMMNSMALHVIADHLVIKWINIHLTSLLPVDWLNDSSPDTMTSCWLARWFVTWLYIFSLIGLIFHYFTVLIWSLFPLKLMS